MSAVNGNSLGSLYLDASALVKMYVPEPGSRDLNEWMDGRRDAVVSDLTVTELVATLSRHEAEGRSPEGVAATIYRELTHHLREQRYRKVDLTPSVHRAAEQALLAAPARLLRAGDALHLAMALSVGVHTMVTFDTRLARVAVAAGLSVFPQALS